MLQGTKQLVLLQVIETEGESAVKSSEKHHDQTVTGASGDVAWSSDTLVTETQTSEPDFNTSRDAKSDG